MDPQTPAEIALVAFMAGALYSLTCSIQYRFDDRRMTPEMPRVRAELVDVLARISEAKEPPSPWLSGFYIDSAMHRIAALGERLGKELGSNGPLDPQVPDAVNAMKHELDAGIGEGWEARFRHVLKAAHDLLPLLRRAVQGTKRAAV